MLAESTAAEGTHNHPVRCCCEQVRNDERYVIEVKLCPACPEHGEIVHLECPRCHTPYGRPHTDYCQLQLARDPWATSNPWVTSNREYPGQRPANDPAPVPICDGRNCGGYPHE